MTEVRTGLWEEAQTGVPGMAGAGTVTTAWPRITVQISSAVLQTMAPRIKFLKRKTLLNAILEQNHLVFVQ